MIVRSGTNKQDPSRLTFQLKVLHRIHPHRYLHSREVYMGRRLYRRLYRRLGE